LIPGNEKSRITGGQAREESIRRSPVATHLRQIHGEVAEDRPNALAQLSRV
jgi:hypothetical protein